MAHHELTPWQIARMAGHQAALLAAETRRLGERPLHPLTGVPAHVSPGGIVTPHQPQVGDVITTAEELDLALTEGPLDTMWFQCIAGGYPWICFCDDRGEWWAQRPISEEDPHPRLAWRAARSVSVDQLPIPFTIAATSDTPPRPERVVKAEALREAADWVANSLVGDPTAIDALEVIARDLLAEADRIEAGEPR